MILDLHSHYPMHLAPEARGSVPRLISSVHGRWRLVDSVRSAVVRFASRIANYESFHSGPRVTVPLLRSGGVGVCLSVLYSPFDEFDLTLRYPGAPQDGYFGSIVRQLEDVERELAADHAGLARVARSPAQMDAALEAGEVAVVHCIEGGFAIGSTPEAIDRNVAELARRGVAYITIAHLVYRQIATNTNAIPFLADWIYDLLFPQPKQGLSELGRAAIRACVEHRVLIDLSHMNDPALDETFALLDELDPGREVPVLASHVGHRFGRQDYNLTAATIERIAARDGVVGLILAEHQAADGLRRTHTRDLEQSLDLLLRHISQIREITGSHRHAAFGTDLDGFIKPTLAELEDAGRLALLERGLRERLGDADAEAILSGNGLRLLREYWRGASSEAPGTRGSDA
ncbi:MAG: dipeptidase [Solirubrobacterales bacterium]